jgi:DNA-binding MarR family transcriptional regulator
MSGILSNINKVFDHRVRLGIMSVLAINDGLDFNRLKEILEVTDGNLASHMKALEQAEYVNVNKTFVGKKPNTTYTISTLGKNAFEQHLKALEALIKSSK